MAHPTPEPSARLAALDEAVQEVIALSASLANARDCERSVWWEQIAALVPDDKRPEAERLANRITTSFLVDYMENFESGYRQGMARRENPPGAEPPGTVLDSPPIG